MNFSFTAFKVLELRSWSAGLGTSRPSTTTTARQPWSRSSPFKRRKDGSSKSCSSWRAQRVHWEGPPTPYNKFRNSLFPQSVHLLFFWGPLIFIITADTFFDPARLLPQIFLVVFDTPTSGVKMCVCFENLLGLADRRSQCCSCKCGTLNCYFNLMTVRRMVVLVSCCLHF